MTDIRTVWNVDEMNADWIEATGALASGGDFTTAVIISLFTDRLARVDDPVEDNDRRGWWGDSNQQKQLGSRLWLIRREKLTRQIALRAEEYAREALKWLVDDGVVLAVEPAAQLVVPSRLNLFIRYLLPQRTEWETLQFYWVWETQINAI